MTASSWPGGLFIALARKFLANRLTADHAYGDGEPLKTLGKAAVPSPLTVITLARLQQRTPAGTLQKCKNAAIDTQPGPHALFMRELSCHPCSGIAILAIESHD